MVSRAVEERDAVEYLAPLARQCARSARFKYGGESGEWLSRAWLAALAAVREFDAERGNSLWVHARMTIPRRMLHYYRTEIGRVEAGQAPRPMPYPVGLFQETREGDDGAGMVPAVEDRGYAETEAAASVASILRDLPEREAELLRWVYLEERPAKDYAAREGVTPAAISHRLRAAEAAARLVAAE